jgi:diguanylate cyclase (GGDEF)-like protein
MEGAEPAVRSLAESVVRDPKEARARAEQQIAELSDSRATDPRQLAALYAVVAQSDSTLELDGDARRAATKGLALLSADTDPVRVDLLAAYAENVYDAAGIDAAFPTIKAARAAQVPGSQADVCLQITLGVLQHRKDLEAEAVVTLTQAYRASGAPGMARQRVAAAEALAIVMRSAGDWQQALALNQEAIDWDLAHDALMDLSVNRYLRGTIHSALHRSADAIEEFAAARQISERLGDQQGIAFADMSSCEALVDLGQLEDGRAKCRNAVGIFRSADSADVLKETETVLARIDLTEGHPALALATLNQVLDHGGSDMPQRQVAAVYKARSDVYAALHDYRAALADLQEYLRRYTAEIELDRKLQGSVQRARFETDRQVALNDSLETELASSEKTSERQTRQLRLTIGVIVVGAIVTALLAYVLFVNLRYRRELLRHADQDGLTGLSNRRRTTEVATAALNEAAATGKAVTIGLIDLDHFKTINDRCGHAVGDHVLKEFATVARSVLRGADSMGRWGGEEFLLILPDTALDAAVAVIDRLRAAAMLIKLPPAAEGLQVSFSAGLATRTETTRSLDDIIAGADSALYQAKNGGRDTVRIDTESYRSAETGVQRALQERRQSANS